MAAVNPFQDADAQTAATYSVKAGKRFVKGANTFLNGSVVKVKYAEMFGAGYMQLGNLHRITKPLLLCLNPACEKVSRSAETDPNPAVSECPYCLETGMEYLPNVVIPLNEDFTINSDAWAKTKLVFEGAENGLLEDPTLNPE